MSKTYSLVALLDVLAYRNHIRADRSSGSENFKAKLETALSVLTSINETELAYQAISDTIIIAANPSVLLSDFICTVAKVQRAFLKSGLLIRGGIAFEQHFKSGNLTYSHALAVAYELEQNQAIYPRVVVDKSVIDMMRSGNKFSLDDTRIIYEKKLLCVQNGIYFVNFLVENLEGCFGYAKSIYEEEHVDLGGREPELAKHRWLQDFILSSSENKTLTPYMGKISYFQLP